MGEPGLNASLYLENDEETSRLGARLANVLRAGDSVLLSGPIGAGKTHLARSIIQALIGTTEEVPSPTFTIVQTYDFGQIEIWHVDLYRVSDGDQLVELGLDEAFQNSIVLIEWPDRMGSLLPSGALQVKLAIEGAGRRIDLISPSQRWCELEVELERG